jgi:hypothetical protein
VRNNRNKHHCIAQDEGNLPICCCNHLVWRVQFRELWSSPVCLTYNSNDHEKCYHWVLHSTHIKMLVAHYLWTSSFTILVIQPSASQLPLLCSLADYFILQHLLELQLNYTFCWPWWSNLCLALFACCDMVWHTIQFLSTWCDGAFETFCSSFVFLYCANSCDNWALGTLDIFSINQTRKRKPHLFLTFFWLLFISICFAARLENVFLCLYICLGIDTTP